MSDMEGHEEPAEGLMQSQHQHQEEEDIDDDDDEDIIIDDESLDEFLQEENQWNTMYHRLRQWGQEHGHCNPRRNWKAKIDAEEKSLGNWAGKQRQEARSERGIDPYKRAALNRLNFAFDVRINNFEEFRKKLDAYLEKQEDGKLPRLDSSYLALQGEGIGRMLHYYYSEPKIMLGILKARTTRHLEGKASTYFTQERIDMLTNAGLEWGLTVEQTQTLKNNFGLIFPPPTAIARKSAAENVFELESSHWAKMLEVLLEFKRKHGHTYVTTFSATEEFNNWVVEQRKKLRALDKHGPYGGCIKNDKAFHDSQAEILKGIGFIYKKQDCDWMENYERLIAYKRLFGISTVSNKFTAFDELAKWSNDQQTLCSASRPQTVQPLPDSALPFSLKRKFMADAKFSILSDEEKERELIRSNYQFFTVEGVTRWHKYQCSVAKEEEEKRTKYEKTIRVINPVSNNSGLDQGKSENDAPVAAAAAGASSTEASLHERCLAYVNPLADCIEPEDERELFIKLGAILSATLVERHALDSERTIGIAKYYEDGRPIAFCRVSGCFHQKKTLSKTKFLCSKHFAMREAALKSRALLGNISDHWLPAWGAHPKSDSLNGEAKVLANNFHAMAKQMAKELNKRTSSESKDPNENFTNIVLGVKQNHSAIRDDEEIVCSLTASLPHASLRDEEECIAFFRRSVGPVASTFYGRVGDFYGDGRQTTCCRVMWCQSYHTGERWRFLCSKHFDMAHPSNKMKGFSISAPRSRKRKGQEQDQSINTEMEGNSDGKVLKAPESKSIKSAEDTRESSGHEQPVTVGKVSKLPPGKADAAMNESIEGRHPPSEISRPIPMPPVPNFNSRAMHLRMERARKAAGYVVQVISKTKKAKK